MSSPRTPSLLVLLGALLCLRLPAASSAQSAEESHAQVLAGILASLSDGEERTWTEGKDRLTRLGIPIAPVIFDLLVGRFDAATPRPMLDERSQEFLREVLSSLPPARVAANLHARIGPSAPIEERWIAVRLIGQCGDRNSLEHLFAILAPADDIALGSSHLQATLEEALGAILARDPTAHGPLREALPSLEPVVLDCVIRSLGRTGRAVSFRILLDLLVDEPRLADRILVELGHPDPRDYDMLVEEASLAGHRHVTSSDRRAQRGAIDMLGNLRDAGAIEELVALVDPADPGLNRVVLGALRKISGLDLGPQAGAWKQWLAAELAWAVESAHEDRARASSTDAAVATAALRRISEHPLHHRALYPDVLPALLSDHESVVRSACRALERLRDPGAIPSLVELLSDPREGVRKAAHQALVSLSGQSFPPRTEPWSCWLQH